MILIDAAKGTAARESDPQLPLATPPTHLLAALRRIYAAFDSFLVIAVSSWTCFDKPSISLRVGTFKACSAPPTRSSGGVSRLDTESKPLRPRLGGGVDARATAPGRIDPSGFWFGRVGGVKGHATMLLLSPRFFVHSVRDAHADECAEPITWTAAAVAGAVWLGDERGLTSGPLNHRCLRRGSVRPIWRQSWAWC